jgi:hypothetical protein
MDELTERQQSLIEQVKAGEITEKLPDTQDQLLALARLGHLNGNYREGQWYFSVPAEQPVDPEGSEPAE